MHHYILEGKTVKPVSFSEWVAWGVQNNLDILSRVNETNLPNDVRVSTIFIGTTYTIFETMIFGGEHDGYQRRCSTWEEAEAQHQQAIELIFEI